MTVSRRTIPSTARLVAFSRACKHGNFTEAANELGITQAAVSRQIRELEDELECTLFVRRSHDVEMTDAGKWLAGEIDPALEVIASAISQMKQPFADQNSLTIFSDHGLAGSYVLPLISRFEQDNPTLAIHLISSNAKIETLTDPFDLAIYYGAHAPEQFDTWPLEDDLVFPVARPGLLDREAIRDISDLADQSLLELNAPGRQWINWSGFLSHHHCKQVITPKARFDSYAATLEAAFAGQGVLLGWGRIIERHLNMGLLERIGDWSMPVPDGIRLYIPRHRTQSPATQRFKNWITRPPG